MGIFTYLKIAALVAALAIGAAGAWKIQGMRIDKVKADNVELKKQVVSYQRVKEIYENDVELDNEFKEVQKKVEKLTPEQLDNEYDRLRNYGVQPKNSSGTNKNHNP
jgi:hypothetical protein